MKGSAKNIFTSLLSTKEMDLTSLNPKEMIIS